MGGVRLSAGFAVLVTAAAVLFVPAADAANGPTFRDCSLFVEGFDPDFVQLFGVSVGPAGALTVSPSQNSVQLEASESSDPGDSAGHVTLNATVTAPKRPAETVSGMGTGKVLLSVPLLGSGTGRTYTINWFATFDNGNHQCPSPLTPDNTGPDPFVVKVTRSPR
jgi:hypothetical protein